MNLSPIPSPSTKVSTLPQTLEQLLSDTDNDLFHDYQHYLEQSFCCENLHFWLDVQDYNDVCGQLVHDDGFQYLQRQAATHLTEAQQALFHVVQQKCHVMIDTYIRPNATQEINLPCELRQELLDQVFTLGNYHPQVFTRSVKSIMELMRVNAFIPWLSSYMNCQSPPSPASCSLQPLSSSPASSQTAPSLQSSSHTGGLSFSFVVDRWHSFGNNNNNKMKPVCRSASMDSTVFWDTTENDHHHHKDGIMDHHLLDMSSPPPSPIACSSPPSSPTKYCRSMLQRVKHSFMPPSPSTIKSSTSWKHQQ